MEIKTIKVVFLQTNCYILTLNDKCLIIDPGDEADKIIKNIDKDVIGILITHYHFDHIGALNSLKDKYKCSIYDIYNCKSNMEVGPFKFETIITKGHKDDCITYYFKDNQMMFVGDFIFKGSIGRCDLEGGNYDEMLKSIELIKKYDDDIKVYPGHGDETTLLYEKQNNPYF